MSDASLGVVNPGFRKGDTATALLASLALASSFNPKLAHDGGRMIALEARSRGFNVQLAGGFKFYFASFNHGMRNQYRIGLIILNSLSNNLI
jgi:beta-glucosidase